MMRDTFTPRKSITSKGISVNCMQQQKQWEERKQYRRTALFLYKHEHNDKNNPNSNY